MRNTLALTALAGLIALPLIAAPTNADASCKGRKNTGTAVGAIGGALLGNSISRGGGGAVIGGLGGAVIGHEIAKSGCSSRHSYYRGSRSRTTAARTAQPVRKVYYDQYGNVVSSTTVARR